MRLRALPLLLVLTGGDYALWDWSIAAGHDVLSLIAGLTLIPLAAATFALVALGAARLLGVALEHSKTTTANGGSRARSMRSRDRDGSRGAGSPSAAPPPSALPAETAAREHSSRRLAA